MIDPTISDHARIIQRLAYVAAKDARTDIGVELLGAIQDEAEAIEAAYAQLCGFARPTRGEAAKARWENR